MSASHFQFDEFTANAVSADSSSYREVLRRQGFSMGVYLLPIGAKDHQHPHHADEVYIVMGGSATLWVDGAEHPMAAGSVVSVDRGVDHHFTDVTAPLSVLVLFAPPEVPDED